MFQTRPQKSLFTFQRQCISWGVGYTQEPGVSAIIPSVPILYEQKPQARGLVTSLCPQVTPLVVHQSVTII